jgi:hypothetical protein
MDVKGEYGRASSTVGGGRYARPPPLALCQLPFMGVDMVRRRDEAAQAGGWWRCDANRRGCRT